MLARLDLHRGGRSTRNDPDMPRCMTSVSPDDNVTQQVFGPAQDRQDGLGDESRPEAPRKGRAKVRPSQQDVDDSCVSRYRIETATNGLDFGKFGHRLSIAATGQPMPRSTCSLRRERPIPCSRLAVDQSRSVHACPAGSVPAPPASCCSQRSAMRRRYDAEERCEPWRPNPPKRIRHSARSPSACQKVIWRQPKSGGSSQFHSSRTTFAADGDEQQRSRGSPAAR